jgi:hypothetical protein
MALSLIAITFTIVLLVIKIRRLEASSRGPTESSA